MKPEEIRELREQQARIAERLGEVDKFQSMVDTLKKKRDFFKSFPEDEFFSDITASVPAGAKDLVDHLLRDFRRGVKIQTLEVFDKMIQVLQEKIESV
jgi:hypothetical protein